MNTRKPIFSPVFLSLALLLSLILPAFASGLEEAVEAGMRESLFQAGMSQRTAGRITEQYLFIGSVMIRNMQPTTSVEEEVNRLRQAKDTGSALGSALSSAYRVYGDKRLQETATAMMHSVRAGVDPKQAADIFTTLAMNGYQYDEAEVILHEASEAVRAFRFPEGGRALCAQICVMAIEKTPQSGIRDEIMVLSLAESERQKALLAHRERERRQRDNLGGGDGGSGMSAGRGGESASSAGGKGDGDGASGNDSSSSGGDSSSGGGSAGDGGGDSSGGSSAGDGGGDSSGGSSAGDGGGDSSGGGSAGDGGGDSSGGGSAGGNGGDSSDGGSAGDGDGGVTQ